MRVKPHTQNKKEESPNQTIIFIFLDIKYSMQQSHNMKDFALKNKALDYMKLPKIQGGMDRKIVVREFNKPPSDLDK